MVFKINDVIIEVKQLVNDGFIYTINEPNITNFPHARYYFLHKRNLENKFYTSNRVGSVGMFFLNQIKSNLNRVTA